MKRNAVLLTGVALAIAGFATSMSLAAHTAKPTVKTAFNKKLGKTVLDTPGGLTLYRNTQEKNHRIRCTGGCAKAWPPLLVAAGSKPVAGAGIVQAKLATIKRPDGKTQVTYGGWPLYRFASDSKPGDANGQGIEGIWFSVTVAGSGSGSGSGSTSPAPPATSSTYSTDTTDTGYTYP